jgi:hypothetical protein
MSTNNLYHWVKLLMSYSNIVYLMNRIVRVCSELHDPEEVASSMTFFLEVLVKWQEIMLCHH